MTATTLQDVISLPDPQLSYLFDLEGMPVINKVCIMAVTINGNTLTVKYLLTVSEDLSKLTVDTTAESAELVLYDARMAVTNKVKLTNVKFKNFELHTDTQENKVVALQLHYQCLAVEHNKGATVTELELSGDSAEIIDIVYTADTVSFLPLKKEENGSSS